MAIVTTYFLFKGLVSLARKIREVAEEELYGEDAIKQKLLEFQMRLELDEITEEEYMAAETALMDRLEEGQRRR
ncbi:MAG: gas vesicle protein GvpG [Chloroflexi bacterium]|nr:gas vesicle protein GvpG [Chloroflexota bacterium]